MPRLQFLIFGACQDALGLELVEQLISRISIGPTGAQQPYGSKASDDVASDTPKVRPFTRPLIHWNVPSLARCMFVLTSRGSIEQKACHGITIWNSTASIFRGVSRM